MKTPDVEDVYAIAIGVDGELCRLDNKWQPIEEHARPFPMSIQDSIIVGEFLIATWIDRELLIAEWVVYLSMSRSRRVLNEVICELLVTLSKRFSRGATWAHVLDAEPLAMTNMDDGFVFVLWNRGLWFQCEWC